MLIANQLKNYGMSCSTDLQHHITTLIAEETITKVVETGTYLGLGTTKAVLKGMKLHGMDFEFISIEVNPHHHQQAVQNNIGSGVIIWNGLSIPRALEPINISFDVPDNIIVDHKSDNYDLYRQELIFDVPDNLLEKACKIDPELVILDSAGHIGFIELKYLLSLMQGKSYWLVLDDTGHVKHYHSLQYIKEMPEQFEVIWESDPEDLHKAAIIKVTC